MECNWGRKVGQWPICTVCGGRIHTPACTGRKDPKKDCCAARHKMLYEAGEKFGREEHRIPMWEPLTKKARDRERMHRALDKVLVRDAYDTPVTKTFTFTCGEEFMLRLEQHLAQIAQMGRQGHSAVVGFSVDGDGSDRLKIAPKLKVTGEVRTKGTYPEQYEYVSLP